MFAYSRFLGWNMNNMIGRMLRCKDSCLVSNTMLKRINNYVALVSSGRIPKVKQINLSKYVCPGLVFVPLMFSQSVYL